MHSHSDDELVNVREAARQCGKDPETIRRWIWSGKLPAEKLGNQLFIKRKHLKPFYQKNMVKETAVVEYQAGNEEVDLKERLRRRSAADFDVTEILNEMREERMEKKNIYKNEEELKKNIDRLKSFREKLNARGLAYDSVELIKEAREGR